MLDARGEAARECRVAIIGAGGFLGATILDSARCRSNVRSIAVVRGPHSIPAVARRADCVRFASEGRLADLLYGADAVIDVSLGPASDIPGSADDIGRAALDAGVRSLVYVSSAAAQSVRRVRFGRSRPGTFYGRQKRAAEATLGSSSFDSLNTTIVRPGVIWGPRSPWTVRHLAALFRGEAEFPSSARTDAIPHLAFGPALAGALLDLATGLGSTGVYDAADTWWRSWEDFGRAFALAFRFPEADLQFADELRLGSPSRLAVEAMLQHPRLVTVAKALLERAPVELTALARRLSKPVSPPPHLGRSIDPARGARTRRSTQAELDFYSRWVCPSADATGLLPLGGGMTREAALSATVAWADDAGFAGMPGPATRLATR